jgi:hypothetical protein
MTAAILFFVGLGKHGAEAFLPEGVSHQRERTAGEAVKCSLGVDDAVAASEGAGELDGGLDAFAPGTAEEGLGEMRAGERGEALGEGSGAVGDVTLQHCRPGGLQFLDESVDDVGMIVAGVVDAVAGEEVEDDAAVVGVQLGADTATIAEVHAEEAKEADPLGIDEVAIRFVEGGGCDGSYR